MPVIIIYHGWAQYKRSRPNYEKESETVRKTVALVLMKAEPRTDAARHIRVRMNALRPRLEITATNFTAGS